MTDAMSRFIAAESARLRAVGIPESRIAWLLGTKPANANEPRATYTAALNEQYIRPRGAAGAPFRAKVIALLASGPMRMSRLAALTGRSLPRMAAWLSGAVSDGHVRRVSVGVYEAVK